MGWGWGGGRSGRVVLIDNGRVYQSKAADALVQVNPQMAIFFYFV